MKEWNEKSFLQHNVWYHATSAANVSKITTEGIRANANEYSELDFGFGFYLTPSIQWVIKYAEQFFNPRIIEFHFSPEELLDKSSNYVFFEKLDDFFAEFVFNNRMYYKNYPTNCIHDYLLVGGVMSDGKQTTDFNLFRNGLISKEELFSRLCLPREDWQISIHSQELCDKLVPYSIFDLHGGIYDINYMQKTINRPSTNVSEH